MSRVRDAVQGILAGDASEAARFPETLTDQELIDEFAFLLASIGDDPHLQDFGWGVVHALESLDAETYAVLLETAYDRGSGPRGRWRHVVLYRALRDASCAIRLAEIVGVRRGSGTDPGLLEAVRELVEGALGPQGRSVGRGFLARMVSGQSDA